MKGYEYMIHFLKEEGFPFKEDEQSIDFKYQTLKFTVNKQDSSYLVISLLSGREEYSEDDLLECCNKINRSKFVVKCTLHKSYVECGYEFRPDVTSTSADFARALNALQNAFDDFSNSLPD